MPNEDQGLEDPIPNEWSSGVSSSIPVFLPVTRNLLELASPVIYLVNGIVYYKIRAPIPQALDHLIL